MTETPSEALARLKSRKPEWKPHPKNPSRSVSGERREVFDQRYAAWEAAIEREKRAIVDPLGDIHEKALAEDSRRDAAKESD
jgi:hypothetical protein